jgi:hypothetical protein
MIRLTVFLTAFACGVLGGALAWPVQAAEAQGKIPTCVPHEQALKLLANGGAMIVEEVGSPYPNGLLIFIHEGSFYAAGVDANCIYSPSTFMGRVPTKAGTPA